MLIDEIRTAPKNDLELEHCWLTGGICGNMEDYMDSDDEYSLDSEDAATSDALKACIEDHFFEDR